MRIETIHWQENQPFTEAYLHHYDEVREWFDYDPWADSSVTKRVQWLDSTEHLKADRTQLYEVLKAYNEKFNPSAEVMRALEQFKRNDALVVIGGQQAGLFSGPLYVIYKAVSLIKEARKLSSALNRPVLPIFWIAGEDHDLDEVNHIYSLSPQVNMVKIKIDTSFETRAAISNVKIKDTEWEQALAQLSDSLLDTEFKNDIMAKLSELSKPSSTLVEGFAQYLAWLFGSYGLIVMDAHDPKIRALETAMFSQMIERHDQVREMLLHTQKRVESRGFKAQAEVREDAVNLFIEEQLERKLLISEPGGFSDKKGESHWTKDELLHIAQHEPHRLSNNVFTRPIMQEYLFPVLSTVLGPGEIAYWGLLRSTFEQFQMKMPIVQPRYQFTLIEGTIQKFMQKFEVEFEQAIQGIKPFKEQWLKAQDELNLEERFSAVKSELSSLYEPLIETVSKINPGLKKLGETNHDKVLEQIAFLEKRAVDAFQSQFDSAIRQWDRIELTLLPLEKRQERVYNIFSYMNKYGNELLDQLLQQNIEDPRQHHIVYL
jgi:bacillithiol biosynthesis cysteine-adding enzyme BshC